MPFLISLSIINLKAHHTAPSDTMKIPYKLISILGVLGIIIAVIVAVSAHYTTHPTNNPAFQSSTQNTTPITPSDKSFIAYFSQTGQPYYPNPPMGMANLDQLATYINDISDSDVYEIIPAEPYPLDLTAAAERAEDELSNRVYPTIANPLPDTTTYQTIFIGFPIWFGQIPMIVQSFLRENNFNNTTIIPFMTHAVPENSPAFQAGDRIPHAEATKNALNALHKLYPKATILTPFVTTSSRIYYEPATIKDEVKKWLDGLDGLELTPPAPTTVALEPRALK